ncbi:Secoisolariciresinol dehydrogenase [Bienertia sinuspersici]
MYPSGLEGKVALITGGASGIGEYTAKVYAKHGAKVMIADIQDDLGKSVCNSIGPSMASYIHCNVKNEAHVQNAVDSTVAQYGKLDIMLNNAVMKPAQQGSIITMGSISSTMGGLISHAYCSSKHGVVGLTRNTAVELGKYGIRVNCVSTHVIATPLTKKFFNLDDEGVSKVYSNLKGACCKLEDAASAALYLATDESKFISGHNLVVDGGFTIMNSGFCMF